MSLQYSLKIRVNFLKNKNAKYILITTNNGSFHAFENEIPGDLTLEY